MAALESSFQNYSLESKEKGSRKGFGFSELFSCTFGDKITVKFPKELPKSTVQHTVYQNYLVYRPYMPKSNSWSLGNALFAAGFVAKDKVFYINEINTETIAINDMYEVLHRGEPALFENSVSDSKNLLIVVDPQCALPLLLKHIWRDTSVVVILTQKPIVKIDQFLDCDCVICCPSLYKGLSKLEGLPLVLKASSIDSCLAHIRAFIQSSNTPRDHYFYSFEGRKYKFGPILRDASIDFIVVGGDKSVAFQDFGSYLANLVGSANDVIINSKWLYLYETLILKKNVTETVARLLRNGARFDLVDDLELAE